MNTPNPLAIKAKSGAPEKALEAYLVAPLAKATSLSDYLTAPASAFLKHVCEAHDAFELCKNKFTKKNDGTYNSDSADSLQHIAVSLVATTMSHFETYEKGLFAGVFERTRFFAKFDLNAVAKALGDPVIGIVRFGAYRGLAAPVGLTVADALSAWHSPRTVNAYFLALGIKQNLFSNGDIEQLELLWQLRHSIVHTGAFLTRPDSQKVTTLRGLGDRAIAFDPKFINALSRRLHKIVKGATGRLHSAVTTLLGENPSPAETADLASFLGVNSPKSTWL